ncbi:MAG: hypothetical protein ACF788_01360 [Novipirellula sp. JB048]
MVASVPALPGGNNTYVRSFGEGSDKLVTGFSRNVKDFPLNRYIQQREVTLKSGFYLKISTEEAGRVLNANLADFVWPDGSHRPQNNDGTELFAFQPYYTTRYDYAFKLGFESRDQAAWGIVESHEAIKAQQAMTARCVRVHSVLGNNANWEADHVKDVTTITSAGASDAGTSTNKYIQKSINYALDIIIKATLSVVRRKDMLLVMNPTTARELAATQEIAEYLKGSRYSLPQVRQGDGDGFDEFGLPPKLYGVETVIEDTTKVTSRRGASTRVANYVMPDGVAYLLARPGGLVAPPGGGPSFSTVSLFLKEDMTVQTFDDDKNRLTEGHVVDDNEPVITASASGFKFTGILT